MFNQTPQVQQPVAHQAVAAQTVAAQPHPPQQFSQNPTFAKLRDPDPNGKRWGVRLPQKFEVGTNGPVTVHRKDGTTEELVINVFHSGDDYSLSHIVPQPKAPTVDLGKI